MAETILGSETVETPEEETVQDGPNPEGTQDEPVAKEEGDESGKDSEGKADEPQGAPESYEDFTLPEGFEVIDSELFEESKGLFKELDLPQDKAQKLIDQSVKLQQKATEKQWEHFNKTLEGWEKEAKKDSEYGGDKFESNVAKAVAARTEFGTPEFQKMLDETGVGNHPEMIRFMYRIGLAMGDDDVEHGRGVEAGSEQDRLNKMFPTMAQ